MAKRDKKSARPNARPMSATLRRRLLELVDKAPVVVSADPEDASALDGEVRAALGRAATRRRSSAAARSTR